ncbi:MAG: ankyrin repeat domain-containing protein, partial [Gammaproteobacteria bacterium]|nr:ankyrin repeat domain-containing protein [Gammaproteobacteria bacterium]
MRSSSRIEEITQQLFEAIESKATAKIKDLIEQGADLAAVNKTGKTAAQLANHLEWWDGIEAILETLNHQRRLTKNKDDAYKFGDVLLTAVIKDKYKIAQAAIQAGAGMRWTSTPNNNSCLHAAVSNKNIDMIQLLLNHHAKQNIKNKDDQTPFNMACTLSHWKSAEALIQHKSFELDNRANIAFLSALKANQFAIADQLIERGLSIDKQKLPTGNTCLHWLAQNWPTLNNKIAISNFLFEHGYKLTLV